ncbi:unnamed protein product [Phytophthora fragariaefolia]|uniref:Unnamed protein product n=1 Tax=Phytophthora fragariaefolia TaxID=1490495 RepID=A0A9W6WIQ2_9STRA|nr:unnamed protein product [Phytophthora fragariaefolia]
MVDSVQESVRHMLRLLAVELIEWRQLVVGEKFKVVPSLDVQAVYGRPPILEYHAEDTEGDLLMTSHEFNLSGRSNVLHLRMTGLRPVWISEGSSTGEPNSKRRQYHPPHEDLLTSLPSVLQSLSSSRIESIQDARTFSSQDAGTLPNQVGTTDGSSLVATTSGSYASRNSSSGSSSAALGYSAASLMQYAGYGPMGMSAQASGSVGGGVEMGFYVTRETIPERRIKAQADQDDVELVRSVSTSSAQVPRTRISKTRRKHRNPGRSSSSSDSESGSTGFKPQATVAQEVPVQEIPDVAALIQAVCAEAARVERERVEALALQHIQQQKAEDDERHEAERVTSTQQAQAGLEVQQRSLLEKHKAVETVCVQEQEAARNIQKFQAEQIRNLKASSAET